MIVRLPFVFSWMVTLSLALSLACGGCGPATDEAKAPTPVPERPTACTQEAKVCPDGTAVSRSGPNCEFAACPQDGGAPSKPELTPTSKP